MQPTMKLRLVCPRGRLRGQPCLVDSCGDSYVLQQWWEGRHWDGKPAQIIKYEGPIPPDAPILGEWRDVPVETE